MSLVVNLLNVDQNLMKTVWVLFRSGQIKYMLYVASSKIQEELVLPCNTSKKDK